MPRMLAPPYQNAQHSITVDAVKKRRAQRSNNSMLHEKMQLNMPPLTLTHTGAQLIKGKFQTPNRRRGVELAED